LAAQPQDVPDIHPNVAGIFKHKVERLAETLNHPEDRHEASEAIRALIEKIVLHPGKGRGEMHATLHGELGNLLDFAASRGQGTKNTNTPGARASGVSVSGIAGAGFEPAAFRL
ncbi:recombinase family protein, partial [Brytella acorum]